MENPEIPGYKSIKNKNSIGWNNIEILFYKVDQKREGQPAKSVSLLSPFL